MAEEPDEPLTAKKITSYMQVAKELLPPDFLQDGIARAVGSVAYPLTMPDVPHLDTFTAHPDEIKRNMMIPTFAPIIIGTPYTPEELAEIRQKHAVEWRAVQEDYQRTREQCAGQPAALAALDVHKPIDEHAIRCDLDESDELWTDWPCSTYEAIRDAVQ